MLCPLPILPEQALGNRWFVTNGTTFIDQPGMQLKLEAQGLAELAVISNNALSVRIFGAMGTNSNAVNGIFDPTKERSGGLAIYRKRSDPEMWLEYNPDRGQWYECDFEFDFD